MRASTTVGPPTGDVTASVASTPASRCRSPTSPDPFASWAPPTPSSSTRTVTASAVATTDTRACPASLCLAMLVSVSATTK
jgi:hypothetical protein